MAWTALSTSEETSDFDSDFACFGCATLTFTGTLLVLVLVSVPSPPLGADFGFNFTGVFPPFTGVLKALAPPNTLASPAAASPGALAMACENFATVFMSATISARLSDAACMCSGRSSTLSAVPRPSSCSLPCSLHF